MSLDNIPKQLDLPRRTGFHGERPIAVQTHDLSEHIFGDGRLFHVTTNDLDVATDNEVPFFLLKNDSSNTFDALLFSLFLNQNNDDKSTFIRMYKNATITANGTALTEQKMNANSSNTAVVDCFSAPTASNNGSLVHTWLGPSKATPPDWYIQLMGSYNIIPGENVLFTIEKNKDRAVTLSMIWGELDRSTPFSYE